MNNKFISFPFFILSKNIWQSLVVFILVLITSSLSGQDRLPKTGQNTITKCSGTLSNSGGTNYENGSSGFTIIKPGTPGALVRIDATSMSREAGYDFITIYDGEGTGGAVLFVDNAENYPNVCRNLAIPQITSTTGALTVKFNSNNSGVCTGFSLTISCITPENKVPSSGINTYTMCSGTLYDSGGSNGRYENSSDGYAIIKPATPSALVRIGATTVNLESGYNDYLTVYDGEGTGGTILYAGAAQGSQGAGCKDFSLPQITSVSGSLTVRFRSDPGTTCAGFALPISCITPPCSGTPNPGNTLASVNPLPAGGGSTVLSVQNATAGSGVTYQWKSSADGVTFTNIAGATSSTYTATITASTFFRCAVTCGGSTGVSNPVQIKTNYCSSYGNTSYNTGIRKVVFNTINTGLYPIAKISYRDNTNISTNVTKGSSYNLTVNVNTAGSYTVETIAWIDWNQNSVFEANEEYKLGLAFNDSNYLLNPLNITVPSGAASGQTRMRISVRYNQYPTACDQGFDGEVQDYTITVLPEIPITVTSSASLPICPDISTTLTATSTASPAYSFTWSPAFGLNTTTGATVIATPIQTTTYTVTGTNGASVSVQKITVTVSPTPKNYTIQQTVSPVGATACSEDYVKLDILGMPDPFPFKDDFSPIKYSYTKITPVDPNDNTIILGIDMKSSNSSFAGGFPNELNFFSKQDNYAVERDWYLYPNTGVVGTYLPISLDGYSAAFFNFKSLFQSKGTGLNRNVYIEISTDTLNWTSIWSLTNIVDNANTATSNSNINLSAYLGSVVYLRFHYLGSGSGLENWYLDDIIISGTIPPVSWSPNTGLYTDTTLTTAYTGGDVKTLYAAPNGSQLYTLSTSISPCSKSTTSTIVHTKKKFTATAGIWSADNNWFPAGSPITPTYIDDRCVNIPNGKSVVVDVPTAIAKSLTVDAGGKLTITKNQSLTVSDGINNKAGAINFVVENDANLLQINDAAVNTGDITVKRNSKMVRLNYIYWGVPVTDQKLGAFSPATVASRFYSYNEKDDSFSIISPLTQAMVPGKGYVIRAPNNFVGYPAAGQDFSGIFKGGINNGVVPQTVTKIGAGKNLLGNPYPSNIILNQLTSDNPGVAAGVYYFWTNFNDFVNDTNIPGSGAYGNYTNNHYATWTSGSGGAAGANGSVVPTGTIKPGQGFLLVASNPGTVKFKNSIRTKENNDSPFYSNKKETGKVAAEAEKFRLKLTTPIGNFNTLLLAYVEGATNNFEPMFDAEFPVASSDQFYSISDGANLIIQGRQYPFIEDDIVRLGMAYFIAGDYTISLSEKEGIFENGQNIYLKDKQTGIVTNLSEGDYMFTANEGVSNTRFEIIYKPEIVLGTDSNVKEGVIVYRDSDVFVIKSPKTIKKVEVYDLSGRLIALLKPDSKEGILEASKITKGIYVLKITATDGEITNKKISK